jgi:hypothetical protein
MNEPGSGSAMREGARSEGVTDRRQRKLARLRGLEAESDEALFAALPLPGTQVEGLVLERVLGQGGYGTVYLASRDGRPYAVKFTPGEGVRGFESASRYESFDTSLGEGVRGFESASRYESFDRKGVRRFVGDEVSERVL